MTPLLAQRSRSDRSFERIYRRHVGDVYRYALAVMHNQADAEDVTQTTFMNALRAFQRGERPEKPQNWLIAIAHNVCRQRFRQTARRPTEVAFDDDVGNQLVEPEDETPTGEDIRRALGHLAFNQRAALVMRELEGRSYAEIAEILELSPSAVETLIFRARRALREQLESSLTCGDAELAISRQLDGRLSRQEKGALRAHLRECKECASFARRQRAQRTAIRSLAAIPVPTSLTSLFGGGGGAAVGTGLAVKAAGALAVGALAGGAGYEGVQHVMRDHSHGQSVQPVSPKPPVQSAPASVHGLSALQKTGIVHAGPKPHGQAASHAKSTSHATQAKGHAAKRTAHGHGRGHAKVHGDASVAARHAHVAHSHPVHKPHPVQSASGRSSSAPSHAKVHARQQRQAPKPAPRQKAKQAPGPYDAGPPPGNGKGNGNGNGKGK